MNKQSYLLFIFLLMLASYAQAQGGHGPSFTLATPTLPKGNWNFDLTLMSLHQPQQRGWMTRQTLRYGLTENLQLNLSIPQIIRPLLSPPRTRLAPMMGSFSDAEGSIFWRFHRQDLNIGSRFESTVLISFSYPLYQQQGNIPTRPGGHLAVVTGYASRTLYLWTGGGIQAYLPGDSGQPGTAYYLTGTLGWRPPIFQNDYPKPDWRIFLETFIEHATPSRTATGHLTPTATRWLAGPSVLGLYGKWGIAFGLLFPIHQQPVEENSRFLLNLSYWL